MKRLLCAIFACLALLCGCEKPPQELPQEQSATATTAQEYIWTMQIDDSQSRSYGDGLLTAVYEVHLSASRQGAEPFGEYRGEIRVDYDATPDESGLLALQLLGCSYDFEGWGENTAAAFDMLPYDHAAVMEYVAGTYQGEGARVAPLLQGIAMFTAQDLAWTDSDWEMGVTGGEDGLFNIDVAGDETGGFGSVFTPFGSASATSGAVPLRYSVIFTDESHVRLDIWSHGTIDVELSFNGTLDKVPVEATVAVP